MQLRQAVDETLARLAREGTVACEFGRDVAAKHDSMAALHQIERRTDHRRIFAKQIDPRRRGKHGVHRFEHVEFPSHVMRFRRHRAERRPAQHVLAIAGVHQIREVRMPAGELLDRESMLEALDFATQVITERAHVDFLARTDGRDFRNHQSEGNKFSGKPNVARQ